MVNLHDLASKGDVEGVRKFLQKSASKVDKTNRDKQTALHCAAKGYGRINVDMKTRAFMYRTYVRSHRDVCSLSTVWKHED